MKILIISDAWLPQLNGVVRTYQNMIPELEKLGHEVKILGPRDFKVRVSSPWDVELAFFTRRKIEETIDDFNPNRIHIAVEGPMGWTALKICKERNLEFSTCYHTNFPVFLTSHLKGPFKRFADPLHAKAVEVLRSFHNQGSGIFVATEDLGNQLKQQGYKGPFLPMTRGMDSRYFYVGEKTLFKELPKPIALYVGRVSKEKNIDAFLSAHWHGTKVVVGDGADLDRLRKTYLETLFLGRKEGKELGDCFRSADIFAFPSKFDTFGIVMIEALACGLPIAAFNADGARTVVSDPMLGALNDDFEMAMQSALKAKGSREERAYHATKLYSWGKTAKQFLEARPNYG